MKNKEVWICLLVVGLLVGAPVVMAVHHAYSSHYQYCRSFIVKNPTGSDLVDFPTYIKLAPCNVEGVVFTDDTGRVLPSERRSDCLFVVTMTLPGNGTFAGDVCMEVIPNL